MNDFERRHIGTGPGDLEEMLSAIGVSSLNQLMDQTVPRDIRISQELNLPEAINENEYLRKIREIADTNEMYLNCMGQGYYGTVTPSVIRRNIFENPGWYTQYTPYQAEISQGRLEALLNFQTMVSDLCGLPIANASLLDEGTAAAEAMSMFYAVHNKRVKTDPANEFLVADGIFPQTIDVIRSRAEPSGIEVKVQAWRDFDISDRTFAILLQYPDRNGLVEDYSALADRAKEAGAHVIVVADLLSLSLLRPPGEWGAEAVVGNTQRFGVPMGCGGPHAAYFATEEAHKRVIPGRIIGVSIDAEERPALRMALQTREQHIRREKATSNICTAQALLAIMAGMYAVWHGPEGLRDIATRIAVRCRKLVDTLKKFGYEIADGSRFDTIRFEVSDVEGFRKKALANQINFFYSGNTVYLSLDEAMSDHDLLRIANTCAEFIGREPMREWPVSEDHGIAPLHLRSGEYMSHPVFHAYQTETELMRYIKSLENKDLSLMHSMIPLGSCTMKLNAATQLYPVSFPQFAQIHPFTPTDQIPGYLRIFRELEQYLCEITGFSACSLQPNSGAQGEFAGLMVIRAYHHDRDDDHRDVTLIPESAHGTNPASAVMAGTRVVVVDCDEMGNIDLDDLKKKAKENREHLAALMVTYPSTHGVFEAQIREICDVVHDNGGLVYMDGANMNAQVGLTNPHAIGADVCHLNLHKTFAIPHGGGGPGMGPICVNEKLAPYLPGHFVLDSGSKAMPGVAAAPWGSASILLISHAYIELLGKKGVTEATKYAILTANYLKSRLEEDYQVLYVGDSGRVAHELILDLRPFKALGVSAEDVAKRLIDYGFHAPTLSFPVPGTIMIEPTESESKVELDYFVEAMRSIKSEIDEIARGQADPENNVLHNAPHPIQLMTADKWPFPYSREKAAYPVAYLKEGHKFWVMVSRVNNGYGDRNLVCVCPPVESYREV